MGKIGIMGGTFDPIHNGHLLLGKQAYEEYDLDEVWYMPSGQPPHKKDHQVTDAILRCEMTQLAIAGIAGCAFSDFEIRRYGNTYTDQTLKFLHKDYPQHSFFFIIGADSLYEIESWHEPARVIEQVVILVAHREFDEAKVSLEKQIAYLSKKYQADIRLLHCQEVNISSEELRKMAARGKSLVKYVPKSVAEYIQIHHLYQEMI